MCEPTNSGESSPEPGATRPRATDDAASHHEGDAGPENHRALVFETPEEQLAAVVPFVRQGLERNERVMYFADVNSPDELRDAFRAAGIDVDAAFESGALSIHSATETYARSGSFDAEGMIATLEATMREVVDGDEYDRLRVTGEMTWALDADADTLDSLVEYESKVNDLYPGKPIIGLCQYDRTRFSPDLLHDVIRAHPHQVYNATVTQNFSYLPPEEFFAAEPSSSGTEALVEAHLERVRACGERAEHERTLSVLAESSRDLLHADVEEVVDRTIDTIESVLSPSVVAVFFYEEDADELQPKSVRLSTGEDPDSVSLPNEYQDLLWESFTTDESRVFSNVQSETELPSLKAVLQSGVVCSLARHGALFVGSTRPYGFEGPDVEFVETVAHAMRAALERVDYERTLERQNEQLRHLDRINRTIRRIDQALVRASSREEIERVVCEELAEADAYRFVWIGDRDPITEQFCPRQWAGDGEPYLDDLFARSEATDESDGTDRDPVPCPARRALDEQTAAAVPNALTTTEFHAWRRVALANGLHAALSVPLVHNNTEYGVLSVYASAANAMTEMEQEVLRELGATIAYAIDAAETKASRHTNRLAEVSLRIRGSRSRLFRLATEIGGSLDIETVLPESGGDLRLFFTVADAPADTVLAAAETAVSVKTIRRITDRSEGALFEVVLTVSESVPRTMAEFNASVTRLTATPEGVEMVGELPQTADVREFVERFRETYPDTSVSSIRRVQKPRQRQKTFYASVEDRLTDRQLEALRLAYHSGYFEWPRDSSATDVAESMGVTQPTFNGHLRAGERKLLELLFDS